MASSFPDTLGMGATGPRGFSGGWTFHHKFEATTSAPPSSGRIRFNHSTPASVTHVYINKTDKNAVDVSAALAVIIVNDMLRIFGEDNDTKWHAYTVTAVTDNSGYIDLTVTHLAGAGLFSTGTNVGIGWSVKGAQGIQGVPGNDGADGFFSAVDVTYKTDGSFNTGSTTFVNITGAAVTWTHPGGLLLAVVTGSFGDTAAAGSAHDAILGITFDGGSTDFPLVGTEEHTGGTGNDTRLKPCSAMFFGTASAGSKTAQLRLRTRNILGLNAQICATADMPLRLSIAHN